MKLFDLYATLGLDSSNFTKGLTAAKNFAVNTASAVAKTTAAAFTVASVAMAGMVKSSLSAMGELEQNIGGSEAVFKSFAATVQAAGKTAYETMGLSQSEYLATANKMAALMQGSGVDIQQSMELTTQAMQRAADVASIMGIDTQWAMESIAGAAKGNFTMMDNLGVAMNATTIEAYALSKGIETAYTEMDNATKIGLAMEMFLEKTEYAAGNYAKENETLAGSFSTVRAAYQNFLSGAGNARDLAHALSRAGRVVAKNMKAMIPGLVEGLNELFVSLTPELPALMESILPGIIQGAGSLLRGLGAALPELAVTLVDSVPMIIDELTAAAARALPALIRAIMGVFTSLPQRLPEILKETGELINTVWSKSVWPTIQSAFRITIGVNLPKWEKTKLELRKQWDESGMGEWFNERAESVKEFGKDTSSALNTLGGVVESIAASLGDGEDNGLLSNIANALLKSTSTSAVLTSPIGIPLWIVTHWIELKENVANTADAIGNFFSQTIPTAWKTMIEEVGNWWHDHITVPIQTAIDTIRTFFGLQPLYGGDGLINDPYGKTPQTFGGEAAYPTPQPMLKNPNTLGQSMIDALVDGLPKVGISHATGLSYVPVDDYVARLHRGEAVLTREQAKKWRRDEQSVDMMVVQTEENRMRPIVINVDGKTLVAAIGEEMGRNIGNANIEQILAMGGV